MALENLTDAFSHSSNRLHPVTLDIACQLPLELERDELEKGAAKKAESSSDTPRPVRVPVLPVCTLC